MNVRRISLAVGAATGGMLTAAFLQTAVAFADPAAVTTDVFGFTLDPDNPPQLVSPIGLGIPPLFQEEQGFAEFDVYTTSNGIQTEQGTFYATTTTFEAGPSTSSTSATSSALFQDEQIVVTDGTPATIGADTVGTIPGDGSVYNITEFAGFTNAYSDVVSSTGSAAQVVTDDLYTPFSTTPIDLSNLFNMFDFAVIDQDVASLF